jgi:hypothetical protein
MKSLIRNAALVVFFVMIHSVLYALPKYYFTPRVDFYISSDYSLKSISLRWFTGSSYVSIGSYNVTENQAQQCGVNCKNYLFDTNPFASFVTSQSNFKLEVVASYTNSGGQSTTETYLMPRSGGNGYMLNGSNGGVVDEYNVRSSIFLYSVISLVEEQYSEIMSSVKPVVCDRESIVFYFDVPFSSGRMRVKPNTPTGVWESFNYDGSVSLSDLPTTPQNPSWINKELVFQAMFPDGTYSTLNSSGSTVTSRTIGGFAFIKSNITFSNPTQPTCAERADASVVMNLPALPLNAGYLFSISRWVPDPWPFDYNSLHRDFVINGNLTTCAFVDGVSANGDGPKKELSGVSQKITINNTFIDSLYNGRTEPKLELKSGLYLFNVRTQTGSPSDLCSAEFDIYITPPAPLSLKLTSNPIETNSPYHTKKNGDTGSVTVTAAGGRTGCTYKYKINNAPNWTLLTNSTIGGLKNGDVVKLSNNDNCAEVSETVVFTQPATLALSEITPTPPTCHDNNDASSATNRTNGSISFKITGGIADYTVKLQKKNVSGTFEALPNTFVKDQTTGVCTFSGLGQGIYNLVLSDAYSSETSNSVTSEDLNLIPSEIVATDPTPISLNCYGDKTTINIPETLSSTYVLEYKTSTASTYTTFIENSTELSADTYNIKVLNANRTCSELLTTTVSHPSSPLSITCTTPTNPQICNEGGSAVFNISGGKVSDYPYQIEIVNTSTSQTVETSTINSSESLSNVLISSLPEGSYTATAYSNHCTSSAIPFTIGKTNPLSVISYNDIVKESCVDNFDAQITLTNLDKIVGDYDFSGGGTLDKSTHVINGLTSKSYAFTITETETDRRCSTTIPVPDGAITVVEDPLHFNGIGYTSTASSCSGATNGTLTVSAGGAFDIVSYTLTNTQGNLPEINTNGLFGEKVNGTYTITIKDKKGCSVTKQAEIEAGENPVKIFTATPTSQSCATVINGAIGLTGLGHAANKPLDIWLDDKLKGTIDSKTEPTYTLPKLSAGSYDVTVKDGDGCFVTLPAIVGNLQHSPTITRVNTELLACEDASNGQVTISATTSYATNHLTFEFSQDNAIKVGVSSENNIYLYSNLKKSNYSVTVTDAEGCFNTLTSAIPLAPPLTIQFDKDDIIPASCQKINNGLFTVSAINGKPYTDGYDFEITGKDVQRGNPTTFSGLPARESDYIVKVKDSEGCLASRNFPLKTIPNPFEITKVTANAATCNGYDDGSITIEANDWDDKKVYEYKLTDQANNVKEGTTQSLFFGGLLGAEYHLWMKSPDGCESETDIEVFDPIRITVSEPDVEKVKDFGEATGSIGFNIANGSGLYDYEFTNADGIVFSANTKEKVLTFPGLKAGHYQFKLKDTHNCLYFKNAANEATEWATFAMTIDQPERPLKLTYTQKDITCYESKDGEIEVFANGGWLYEGNSYQYSWSEEGDALTVWDVRNKFPIASPGTYRIGIKDNEGIVRSDVVTIVEPKEFLLSDPQTKDATCRASSNGWVKISHINGIDYADGLHYRITPDGSTTPIVEHNVSGDYYYGHLSKGYYTLTVNDSHLCTASKSFAIGAPDTVQIISDYNYIRKKGQSTGEIKATLSKGSEQYLYRWYKDEAVTPFQASTTSAGMLSITGQAAGKYRLEIKDTANCNYEGAEWMHRSFELKEPEKPLMLVAEKNVPVDCSGEENGIIQLNAAGGWGDYLYRTAGGIYSPQAEYPGLKAGWYTFDVKDSAGIETQLTVEVVEPVPLMATLSRIDQVTCHDGNSGAITMNISGGNGGYEISSNNTDFKTGNVADQLIAGHYTVYIRDAKKCAISKGLYTITQPDAVSNVFNQITKSRCSNNEGAIEANFTGGTGALNYQWSLERFLEDNSHPIVELPQYTTPSISNLYSGKYYLKITDANDCPYNFDYFVSDITDLEISGIETDSVTCFGYSDGWAKASVINGNPDPIKGYSYLWPENRATIHEPFAKGFTAGEYILMVSDEKKCITIDTFTILTPDTLGYTITNITEPLCLGGARGSLSVNASGGTPLYQYQWAHGSTSNTITGLDPVAYELTITDSHACRATFSFPMSYQRTIKPSLGDDVNLCHYQTLPLDGGDFIRYNWQSSNGFTASSRNVTLKDPGTYYLSVTDADNCVGSDTLLMNVSYLKINNLTTSDVTCYGFGNGNASIEVVPADWPHSILWSNKKTIPAIDGLNVGKYNVVVNDGYGCTDSRDFVIQEPAQLTLSSRINDPLCLGVANGQITLEATGGKGTHRFNWMDGNSSSRLTKLDKGTYSLTLSDENGCELNTFFTLNYQRTLFPGLGSDRTLCAGNEVKLYPGLFDGYQWMSNGETVSNDTSLVVSAPAQIRVQVNDEDGCIATDGLSVTQTATTFTPAFLAASSIEVGDTLLLVEVSQPKPLSLKWSFTMPHRVVEETAYAIKVIFDEEGTGEMLLTAFNGDCQGESWKNLLVVSDSGNEAPKPGESNISSNFINFSAAPNPSDGHFNATIKMKEAVAVTLYLVNISTGQIAETRKVSGMADYDEPFTIAGAGYYALFAEIGGERRVVKIVVY